ncbi:MAG: tetratricopeptide repeat protein, partial [Bacteroidetes bacterium]|nr:tetratricopeptide repeat protein [Bacteroidota bacterium]
MRGSERKYLLCIVVSFALIFCLYGQPTENIDELKPAQLLRFGKNYEKAGDIYGAIEFYSRYYMIKMEKIEVAHKLAKLYKEARNYEKARDYYLRCYMSDPRYIECLYYHAQMLKATGDYDKALEFFTIFKKRYRGRELKKVVDSDIAGCINAKKIKADSLNVTLTHLDETINKAHIEVSPVLMDENTLLFSALREDKVVFYEDKKDKPVRKFYIAKKDPSGKWAFRGELQSPVNSDRFDTGNGAFSPDGKKFFFTRCRTDWQNKVHCSVYMSEVNGNVFSEPVDVTAVNDPVYTTTQPTVGLESRHNREVLYFISDRPGGKGGYDIWYSVYNKRKETFERPRNAGIKINTEGNELAPYYDPSTRNMYFSSDGWPGLGGKDIFESTGELTKWLKPVNAGFPVNSSYDEIYYYISKNKTDAFFTSNRPGTIPLQNPTCCDDLYNVLYEDKIILDMMGRVYEITGDSLPES